MAKMTSIHHMAGTQVQPAQFYDRILLLTIVGLLALGLLMVYSASIVISEKQFGTPFYFALRQCLSLGIGLVACFFVLRTPIDQWQRFSFPLLLFSFLILALVLIPQIGHSVNGARRWIALGPIRIQVAEVVKLFVLIYLADYLVRHGDTVRRSMQGFLIPLVILSGIAVLLLLQPDFGSTAVIFATCLGVLFIAGARLLPFLILMSSVVGALGLLAITSPYRMRRLTTFLNPWIDQFDSGYQLSQSLIAFGRGGWFGTGLGESIQKLFYLPEAHTDFLFAVLAEELGILGMLTVVILFAVFIFRGFRIGRSCLDQHWFFGGYLAFGITLWLGLQALVNIGVNMGLLPTKGLTLPLMSYGGASLIITLVAIALLIRIDYESRCQRIGLIHRQQHKR